MGTTIKSYNYGNKHMYIVLSMKIHANCYYRIASTLLSNIMKSYP